jgi:RNA polymerase sigma-70 factor, ECF subfamily
MPPSGHTPNEALDAEELFRRHAPFVAKFLVRIGGRRADVDDLVQEVFLIAHKLGGWAPGPAQPTTWLAEIAVRVASGERRRTTRREARVELDSVDATYEGASPLDRAAASESLGRVEQALETLSLEQRAVFVLFELEGKSSDEIAAGLGIPVGTVYSRLHKARSEFKRAYARLAPDRGAS